MSKSFTSETVILLILPVLYKALAFQTISKRTFIKLQWVIIITHWKIVNV